MNFEELKQAQLDILLKAKEKIFSELKLSGRCTLPKDTGTGYGTRTKKNDLKLYRWIPAMNENNRVFWITLFHNYVDQNTGNIHTDFGRISFVEPYEYDVNKPLNNAHLNQLICRQKNNTAIKVFGEKWHSPLEFEPLKDYVPKNKNWLTVDDVLSPDFDIKALADAFVNYMEMEDI